MAEHERQVWSLARQICGHPDDARDIAQEVFLRVHQHLDTYDAARPFASWLYRITVNCTYDFIRRRPRHESLESPGATAAAAMAAPAAKNPGAHLEQQDLQATLRHLLITVLTPHERAVFILRDVKGLSTREIGYILRRSTITVRRHSMKARLKLRQALASRFPERLRGGRDESPA